MTDGVCPFAEQIPGVTTFTAGGDVRVGFCDHTASGYYSTLQSPAFWNGQDVSAHFAIAKDGRICQLVNLFDTAWAQGLLGPTVIWPPFVDMGRLNPNRYLISIEHEDETELNMVWPVAMYQADLKLKRWCADEVKRVQGFNLLRFGLDSLAGHFMFDQVNRLHCPGAGWPREQLYADLTGGIMADGWVKEGHQMVLYNEGARVLVIGNEDGTLPGQIAKLYGDKYRWLKTADATIKGDSVVVYSDVSGD